MLHPVVMWSLKQPFCEERHGEKLSRNYAEEEHGCPWADSDVVIGLQSKCQELYVMKVGNVISNLAVNVQDVLDLDLRLWYMVNMVKV